MCGTIAGSRMQLNLHGQIIQDQWEWLHRQYSYVCMDEYVVMPNHFHGIINLGVNSRDCSVSIHLDCEERNGHDHSLQKMKPLSQLIGAFKVGGLWRLCFEIFICYKVHIVAETVEKAVLKTKDFPDFG